MKRICFLIGNGSSRKGLDLEQFRGKGTIVGCNALYRDFKPDVLIAIDQKMLKEIGGAKYDGYYVYPKNRNPGFPCNHKIPLKQCNTSGSAAMQYAGMVNADLAFLIGFDCYEGNVYEGSKNYTKNFKRFENFIAGYKKSLGFYRNTKYINVIKDGKDGLTKKLKDEINYLGYTSIDDLLQALPNFPEQEPLYSNKV